MFVTEEWYPGFDPAANRAPFAVDALRPFEAGDEDRFWLLDFHWPRGLTPLGLVSGEDAFNWGAQVGAEILPLPAGRGIAQRLAGTHPYASAIPVASARERQARELRADRRLPRFVASFRARWRERVEELDTAWDYLAGVALPALAAPELAGYLREARRFHRRALEIHFEMMYPLLVNHLRFAEVCRDLDIGPDEIAKFLLGDDTRIMRTDRALAELSGQARTAGLAPLFAATEPEDLAGALAAAGGAAAGWLARLDDFLHAHGQRTEGSFDVALPSWIEDPTPVLGTVRTLLRMPAEHDFDAARAAALQERGAALDAARTRLGPGRRRAFDVALASVRAANFAWWQDEHNPVIDLRIALPMRWAARELAARAGAQRPDDTTFLFWPELLAVADGAPYRPLAGLVEQRRQYFAHWHRRRPDMPKVLGSADGALDDPILVEVFGLSRGFLDAAAGPAAPEPGPGDLVLRGMAAARGVGRGPARVLTDADGLHRIAPGEILVCESTSPNWTPAFAKIAGCVCDGGGMLSHAAIVGREYGVPTVTACGRATALIRDGDDVVVDGTAGTVAVHRRRAW
ncbi:PEP-utilizing enzyme [Dactylosporangium sp. CA-092794]|uniref:PEP-utilizing enzyme n=1 Tax=Dactylosporangium sp. CA-092794 TaxID=3239929 RepID=UPI003D8D12E4